MRSSLAASFLIAVLLSVLLSGCKVEKKGEGANKKVNIETPVRSFRVNTQVDPKILAWTSSRALPARKMKEASMPPIYRSTVPSLVPRWSRSNTDPRILPKNCSTSIANNSGAMEKFQSAPAA